MTTFDDVMAEEWEFALAAETLVWRRLGQSQGVLGVATFTGTDKELRAAVAVLGKRALALILAQQACEKCKNAEPCWASGFCGHLDELKAIVARGEEAARRRLTMGTTTIRDGVVLLNEETAFLEAVAERYPDATRREAPNGTFVWVSPSVEPTDIAVVIGRGRFGEPQDAYALPYALVEGKAVFLEMMMWPTLGVMTMLLREQKPTLATALARFVATKG